MINVFSFSEPGGHVENEDAFEVRPIGEAHLCAVADGQGGRAGGSVAAHVACRACLGAALTYPLSKLLRPNAWPPILQAADAAVHEDAVAGFTTLVAFIVTDRFICGGSCGDSTAVLIRSDGANEVLTARQHKDPPVGSRAAVFVSFGASLTLPWTVLAMSDGVWKYVGLDEVIRLAAENRGAEMIPAIRGRAGLKKTGALQDDFTLVAFCCD